MKTGISFVQANLSLKDGRVPFLQPLLGIKIFFFTKDRSAPRHSDSVNNLCLILAGQCWRLVDTRAPFSMKDSVEYKEKFQAKEQKRKCYPF